VRVCDVCVSVYAVSIRTDLCHPLHLMWSYMDIVLFLFVSGTHNCLGLSSQIKTVLWCFKVGSWWSDMKRESGRDTKSRKERKIDIQGGHFLSSHTCTINSLLELRGKIKTKSKGLDPALAATFAHACSQVRLFVYVCTSVL